MIENSRNKILNKIAAIRPKRSAAVVATSIESKAIYKPIEPDALSCFKTEIEAINGECIICETEIELIEKLKNLIAEKHINQLFCKEETITKLLSENGIANSDDKDEFINMQAGISSCDFLVARTGSIIASSNSESGRSMIIFPPIHLVLAREKQLLAYPADAIGAMKLKYKHKLPSMFTSITGPSRTADIEKTLVLGAHGPKELIVFLLRS